MERGGIDAILLDLQLPDSSGLATFSAIHAAAPDVPVVVFTSVDDVELGVDAVQLGAQDYLPKDRLDPALLGGRLLYAVERQRRVAETLRSEADMRAAYEVQRRHSERLEDLDRMKNTFLEAVAHDLRTPLTAIIGLADTLTARDDLLASPERVRDLAATISRSAQRLDDLLRDLLDLDRLSRGDAEPRRTTTDVTATLIERSRAAGLDEHNVQIERRDVVAEVDPMHLERIVDNLLHNAARHTPPGTTVWVRSERRPEGVLVVVEDDGPGLPDASWLDEAFEPFVRGESSPGTGIGLSLVAALADLHGGRAWAEERSGGGASFRVLLGEQPKSKDTEAEVSIRSALRQPER